MARTARKPAAEAAQVEQVQAEAVLVPETYANTVTRQAARIGVMQDSRRLVGFTAPCTAREGTITHAVWVALANADGVVYPEALRIALEAEMAQHRARGKMPKGTGINALGWLRRFGAVFE
jgi:hypothetical protein